jgi:hypothetical protein
MSKARRRANILKKKVLSASNIGVKTDKEKGNFSPWGGGGGGV